MLRTNGNVEDHMNTISQHNRLMDEKAPVSKRKYHRPVLKTYGLVRNLTQATGTQLGDGGPNMMN